MDQRDMEMSLWRDTFLYKLGTKAGPLTAAADANTAVEKFRATFSNPGRAGEIVQVPHGINIK